MAAAAAEATQQQQRDARQKQQALRVIDASLENIYRFLFEGTIAADNNIDNNNNNNGADRVPHQIKVQGVDVQVNLPQLLAPDCPANVAKGANILASKWAMSFSYAYTFVNASFFLEYDGNDELGALDDLPVWKRFSLYRGLVDALTQHAKPGAVAAVGEIDDADNAAAAAQRFSGKMAEIRARYDKLKKILKAALRPIEAERGAGTRIAEVCDAAFKNTIKCLYVGKVVSQLIKQVNNIREHMNDFDAGVATAKVLLRLASGFNEKENNESANANDNGQAAAAAASSSSDAAANPAMQAESSSERLATFHKLVIAPYKNEMAAFRFANRPPQNDVDATIRWLAASRDDEAKIVTAVFEPSYPADFSKLKANILYHFQSEVVGDSLGALCADPQCGIAATLGGAQGEQQPNWQRLAALYKSLQSNKVFLSMPEYDRALPANVLRHRAMAQQLVGASAAAASSSAAAASSTARAAANNDDDDNNNNLALQTICAHIKSIEDPLSTHARNAYKTVFTHYSTQLVSTDELALGLFNGLVDVDTDLKQVQGLFEEHAQTIETAFTSGLRASVDSLTPNKNRHELRDVAYKNKKTQKDDTKQVPTVLASYVNQIMKDTSSDNNDLQSLRSKLTFIGRFAKQLNQAMIDVFISNSIRDSIDRIIPATKDGHFDANAIQRENELWTQVRSFSISSTKDISTWFTATRLLVSEVEASAEMMQQFKQTNNNDAAAAPAFNAVVGSRPTWQKRDVNLDFKTPPTVPAPLPPNLPGLADAVTAFSNFYKEQNGGKTLTVDADCSGVVLEASSWLFESKPIEIATTPQIAAVFFAIDANKGANGGLTVEQIVQSTELDASVVKKCLTEKLSKREFVVASAGGRYDMNTQFVPKKARYSVSLGEAQDAQNRV